MTNNSTTSKTDDHNELDDFEILVAQWHDLASLARQSVESNLLLQAVSQHQEALLLAQNLSWTEAELFNLRHLIDILEDLGRTEERNEYLRQGIARATELEEANTKAWLCYQLAEALWPEDKSEAFHWYETALETVPFPKDWSAITLYYLTLGRHLRDEQRHTEAATLYEKASKQATKVRDIAEILSFRLKGARAYLAVNNWEMAIEQLQLALALPDISGYPEKAAEILEELGDAYYLSGQQMQAKSIFEQAVKLSRQLSDVNFQINQLLKLGRTYRAVGEPTLAEMVISEALRMARQQQDLKRVVEALGDLSNTKLMLGEQETAVIFLQEALSIVRSLGDCDLELHCLANLASAYHQIGLTTAAVETAVSGLELAFENDDTTKVVTFLSILSSIQDLPHALWSTVDEMAQLALERSQQNEYPLALSECLPVLGDLYIERDPQQALAYYQQLANLFQAQDNISRYITICGLIASAYQYLDDLERAIHTLQEAIDQIEKHESSYLVQEIDILLHLAYLYWRLGDLSQCETCLKSITKKASIDKLDVDRAFFISELHGDLYFSQGNYQLAENAYQAASNLLEQQFYSTVTPQVRLKTRTAGRFLYRRLILASFWQTSKDSANQRRTFEYVEAARSRLFLSQLGQTTIRPPQQLPNDLFVQERELLTQLRLLGQQATAEGGTRYLKEQHDLWHNLRQLWREIELSAGEYVALRRGQPLACPELQSHLQLPQEDETA
ncbi:MAG: tetratricopeptide repeat protein [Anaerolineales bacterium]|nr:tetratricopeptide repeat protein [Anaerolineales bacterium]